jgi:hypothetical protein
MKESVIRERLSLIEKELAGLTDKLDEIDYLKRSIEDMQAEIKGFKLFLSRVHPEFKKQFPEIIKKLKS